MWLLLLAFGVATANREADLAFFSGKTYIPGNEYSCDDDWCSASTSWSNIWIPTTDTNFRLTFNPNRCDHSKSHEIAIGFAVNLRLNSRVLDFDFGNSFIFKSKSSYFLDNGDKDYGSYREAERTAWYRYFQYKITKGIMGKAEPSVKLHLTMNEAHLYVRVRGRFLHLYIFDEDTSNVKFYGAIPGDFGAPDRKVYIMGNQQNACPFYISLVEENFPLWTLGMPFNRTNETIWNEEWSYHGHDHEADVFSGILHGIIFIFVFCLIMEYVAIPLIINHYHPLGGSARKLKDDVHILNLGDPVEEKTPKTHSVAENDWVSKTATSFRGHFDKTEKVIKSKRKSLAKMSEETRKLLTRSDTKESPSRPPPVAKKSLVDSVEPTQKLKSFDEKAESG